MPTITVASTTGSAANVADITAGGNYFNSQINLPFVVTIIVLVVTVAFVYIARKLPMGVVRAIGVRMKRGGRRRR